MNEGARRKMLGRRRRVVVKLGSMVLAAPGGGLDHGVIDSLALQMARLRKEGKCFIIVTSGAILMGLEEMGMKERPRTLPGKQALAAIGQTRLMRAYQESFSRFGVRVGQMLLTREDLASRNRFLTARGAMGALLRMGVVPVINENDTVAVEEIRFGDNDTLSSLVVNLAGADLLVIFSDIAGLYDRDPRKEGARLLPVVERVDRRVLGMAGGPGSRAGSGGMASKVMAAKRAAERGVPTVIADGKQSGNLSRILAGEEVGTLFLPSARRISSHQHWMAYSGKVRGTLAVDRGAARALTEDKKSLLPAGVAAVEGEFARGALVRCVDGAGREIARGVTSFSAAEIRAIMGHHSREITSLLGGDSPGQEVIHRDDLVLSEGR
jgi:glutamate 5-kinase